MKTLKNKLMIVAATVAAAAGTASAQSMTVKVPFSFSVQKSVLPAGNYMVSPLGGNTARPIFNLRNTDTKRPFLIMPIAALDTGRGYGEAKLVFRCLEGDCALAQIWTGSPAGAYELNPPKGGWNGKIRVEIKSTN